MKPFDTLGAATTFLQFCDGPASTVYLSKQGARAVSANTGHITFGPPLHYNALGPFQPNKPPYLVRELRKVTQKRIQRKGMVIW